MFQTLRSYLRGLNLPMGPFSDIIDELVGSIRIVGRRIVGRVSSADLLWAIYHSRRFHQMFPGIRALVKEGLSVSAALSQWRSMSTEYTRVAQDLGINVNVSKRLVGLGLRNGVSPEEFAINLTIRENLQRTEILRMAFNQVAGQGGLRALNRKGWHGLLKQMLRRSPRRLYDQYEAAWIKASGLDVTAAEARILGRKIGAAAQLTDVAPFIAQVRQLNDRAKQELRDAGVTDADLLMLESGSDPKGISALVQRVLNTREALGRAGTAAGGRRTERGIPVVYGAEEGL
jgi:hypothetical protein